MHRAGANGSAVAAPNPLREGRDGVPRHAGGRDFFIVGAAKAGTTALHGFLFDDPRVVLPARKETNFYALQGSRPAFTGPLDDAGINAFSIWDRDDYEGEFRGADPGALQGEVCPWYLYSGVAADAIAADNPMAKIAMVLRDPVERAWSAHRHLVADGRERESFANALALEEMRIRAGWEWFWHHTAVSRYAEQVERYLRAFGRDRVRIYLYRDLRRRPERVLNGLTDFIGLPGNGRQTLERRNLSSEPRIWLARLRTMLGQPDLALRALRTIVPARLRDAAKRAMSADAPGTDDLDRGVRRELTEEFLPDVRRLEALTGLDLGEWKP